MKKLINGIFLLPLFLLGALLPIYVRFSVINTELASRPWFPNQDYWVDCFLYGKSEFLLVIGVLMALLMPFLLFSAIKGRKLTRYSLLFLLPAYAIALWIFVSTSRSQYPQLSMLGSLGQYETTFVLLTYCMICIYSYLYIKRGGSMRALMIALMIGLGISLLIGITQLAQRDFWSTDRGRAILVPEEQAVLRKTLRFNFSYDSWNRVYLALYNGHYAAIYLLMMIPVCFCFKKKWVRGLGVIAAVCLIGTLSKTAYLAALLLLLTCFVLKKGVKKAWLIGGGCAFILLITILCLVGKPAHTLKSITPENDCVEFTYDDVTYQLSYHTADTGIPDVYLVDENGVYVPLRWDENAGNIYVDDPGLTEFRFRRYEKEGITYLTIELGDIVFRFSDSLGTGRYEYITINGKIDETDHVAAKAFLPDHMISGRGYIWNRVLPLILRHPLVGFGPDTFLLAFPQDDYAARANLGYSFFSEVLTNAHSLYLQTALTLGLPVLVLMLFLAGLYISVFVKMYKIKATADSDFGTAMALSFSIFGFMICSLTWAGSVCTLPFFLMIFGAAFAYIQPFSENNASKSYSSQTSLSK